MSISHSLKPGQPQATPVFTAQQMREHLNYYEESTEIDTLLSGFILAGTNMIETLTGRPLASRIYVMKLDCFPREVKFLRAPVTSVVSVKYMDSQNVERTFTDFEVDMDSKPGTMRPKWGFVWPSVYPVYKPITIEYVAGAVPTPDDEELVLALKFLVTVWFKNRSALMETKLENLPAPFGFQQLIAPFMLENF